jgi:threonine/homoserine/homoserine lactone efflux protein
VLIVVPGPGVLFVIGRALAHGRRTALATALGHAAGNYVVAACVAVGRAARDGVVVGITNPKAYILFGAILPQFVNRAEGNVPAQMLILALVSVVIGAASDCWWGFAASGVRAWFARSPRRIEMVGGAGGLAMIGVGVTVALTGRHS